MPCLGIILLKCHENCRTLHRDQETNVELLNIGGTIMKKMMMMAPMMHNSKPAVHNDKKHGTNERHMAMATNNNRSKSGHFSGRR